MGCAQSSPQPSTARAAARHEAHSKPKPRPRPSARGDSASDGLGHPPAPVRRSAEEAKSTLSATLQAALSQESESSSEPESSRSAQHPDPLQQHHKYVLLRHLSDGSAGFVVHAKNRDTQEQVAIKFIERGTKAMRGVDREVLNLRLCCLHPYVVKFKEVFLTQDHIAIVTDFADGGELAAQITAQTRSAPRPDMAYTEDQARQLFQQLIIAVDFCHRKGISNRDLKAENVLLASRAGGKGHVIKLCDFGFSKDERLDSACKTACGTPEYVAPEVLSSAGGYDGKPVDVWSAGVVLYVMLSGRFPFASSTDSQLVAAEAVQVMFQRILSGNFIPLAWISQPCADLLRCMLCVDPAKRIDMVGVLQNPWFKQGLQEGSLEMNANLQLSDGMLTSFVAQSEAEILRLVHAAMLGKAPRTSLSKQRPRQGAL